ncbi:AEC family transporter [Tolumonas lignilytica]|uniref:AEC family transporter n=1 Tax=Tolumonas lignilytica TaxID=1283284 RepID=UPI0004632C3B|nr:AEC family transporter [Tolumonas lignilytica]
MQSADVNQQFMLSICIILLGYLAKRTKYLTEKEGESIAQIIFNITLPALVINVFSVLPLQPQLILLPVLGFVVNGLLCLCILFIFRKHERPVRGMMGMALPGANIGLFAYPLVEAIWGKHGLTYIAMYDLGNSYVVFLVCYTVGAYFSGEKPLSWQQLLHSVVRSVPVMTSLIALSINLMGIKLPDLVLQTTQVIAKANMPLSLLLLGMYLNFSFPADQRKLLLQALGSKYLIGGALGALLCWLLPYDTLFRHSLLLAGVLPLPTMVLTYAVIFGYDRRMTGAMLNASVILSILLSWVVFHFSTIG